VAGRLLAGSTPQYERLGAIVATILLTPDPSHLVREEMLTCQDSGAAAVRTVAYQEFDTFTRT
jgi:hypothetical protein